HLTDPMTGIPVASGRTGDPPGDFEASLEYEFRRPDVARFFDLMGRRDGTAALSLETQGDPQASPRFREMLAPAGSADELRVVLSDAFGCWGTMSLFSARRFSEREVALVSALSPAVTIALRRARTAEGIDAVDEGGTTVVILDAADRVIAADAHGRRRMTELAGHAGTALPSPLYVLAARARARDPERPAHAQARTAAGRWLSLDASPIDDEAHGPVAVVLRPSAPDGVLDTILRAFGLSHRERQVAELAIRGQATKAIAAELMLSAYTVQDHLSNIYEKTDVHSRGDLAHLAFRRLAEPPPNRPA
ncbi:MAG: helix-turn-helix transcriptional regulator, partial [Myxococcota bacterium]